MNTPPREGRVADLHPGTPTPSSGGFPLRRLYQLGFDPRPQGEACLTTGQPASSIGEPDRQRSRLARSPPGRAADLHCPLPCAVTTSMQLLFCVASAAIATSRSRLASGGGPAIGSSSSTK